MLKDMAANNHIERLVRVVDVREIHRHVGSSGLNVGRQVAPPDNPAELTLKATLRSYVQHGQAFPVRKYIRLPLEIDRQQPVALQRPAPEASRIQPVIHTPRLETSRMPVAHGAKSIPSENAENVPDAPYHPPNRGVQKLYAMFPQPAHVKALIFAL
jgi:hypothetical protein